MGNAGTPDRPHTTARHIARSLGSIKARGLNLVEIVLTVVAFALLQRAGLIANTPLWILVAMVIGGGALSALAFRAWGATCSPRQLHYRIGLNMLLSTAVIYATGWGPALAIGYTYIATDAIKHSGARSARPSIIWSVVGITLGQVAIALGAVPTFIDTPEVHGLGALCALGIGFALYTAGVTSAEKERAEADVRHSAQHDRLTGLANRAGFVHELDRAVTRAERDHLTTALLFLDLDRFKIVNDSFGHNVGDHVLVEVANRLRECVRTGDTIGRFGGDEFTILLEDIPASWAADLAERVTAALRRPLQLHGRELTVSASVGLVVTDEARTPDELLRSADLAMYLAKENGRARWELFNPTMGSGILERYRIAAELRVAIEQDQLVTHFQPEISLTTGKVIGFEALVRWEHPDRGLLAPATFIPVAEENDLILGIDRYVVDSACRQLKRLQDAHPGAPALFMSINISPACLNAPCTEELLRIVHELGIDPTTVQLEITERTAVNDAPAALASMQRLRRAGIHLVIDDFGTGYSSLDCLQRLPVDGLKIDRGFVADLDVTPAATAIVNAIVTLGRQLGLRLTAEGVETAAQLERLTSLGCDSAQGFYFARPLSADAVLDLLERTPVA
ncbi:MAG: hypothetical protein QOD92_3235 [Acidimicrobiaceae bacterium]|jgi:diguanylate cyclase (GGDEF)-like protein